MRPFKSLYNMVVKMLFANGINGGFIGKRNRESHMSFNPISVANKFLDIAWSQGKNIDPMKLQKLVYFAHGWHLAIYGKPLVDESFEAWNFGPVLPSVYHAFKRFGPSAITQHGAEADAIDDGDTTDFLLRVWGPYSVYSSIQLSNMSHDQNGPWAKHVGKQGDCNGSVIPDEEIEEYFKGMASSNK